MRLTVIYNPKAGDRGWSKGAVQERLRGAGHEPLMVSSKGRWRAHLDDGSDAIVAAGRAEGKQRARGPGGRVPGCQSAKGASVRGGGNASMGRDISYT